MKPIVFLGDSLDCLRSFPADVRTRAGFELREVQKGYEPTDWKPMTAIGSGAREIRVRGASGAFRILYICFDRRCRLGAACFSEEDAADSKARHRFGDTTAESVEKRRCKRLTTSSML